MTAVIPEGLEPLAVWDVYEPGGWWKCVDYEAQVPLMLAASDWASTRIERTADTFRVEFYLLDAPFAAVHRHMRIFGQLVWNPETRRPHEEEPVIVPLAELPPAHLLKG